MNRTEETSSVAYRAIATQFVKFASVGAIGTGGHYLALIALVHLFSVNPLPASAAGFVVGALINYFLNYFFTFRSDKPHNEAMSKFFLVALSGLLLNSLAMVLATKVASFHYLLAQVMATGLVLIWNFLVNRMWTFKERTSGLL